MPEKVLAENESWTIPQWVDGAERQRPDFSCALGALGVSAFVLAVSVLALGARSLPVMLLAAAGLALMPVSGFFSNRRRFKDWIEVSASCLDCELKELRDPMLGNGKTTWRYRLSLQIECDGQLLRISPETEHHRFKTLEKAERHLARYLARDRTCRVWIDPEDPKRAVFPRPPLVLQRPL